MEKEWEDWAVAIHGLIAAHSAVLRDVMRHLVEEDLMPSDKAARILLDAAANDLPPERSTGATYDAARDEMVSIATALLSWPGNGRRSEGQGPRHDK